MRARMTAADFGVDPTTATSPEQYVRLLRRVRDQSGLAYREIARRAQRNGDVLPASTLATMLGRSTLPRRDLVSALLRACDVPDDRATAWLAVWGRLAAARTAATPPTATRARSSGRPGHSPIGPAARVNGPSGPVGGPDTTGAGPRSHPQRSAALRLIPAGGGTGSAGPERGRVAASGGGRDRAVLRGLSWPAASEPPPVESGSGTPVPYQLPPAPPMMTGRSAEVGQLLTATETDAAVCLVEGAGGVGKSALALHVAHRIVGRYDGGCLYADLRGATDGVAAAEPADVLGRFLRALGLPTVPASLDEASALLRTWTAGRGVLMVLDNAASAAQVRPLLASGPGCTTIVTSRWMLPDLDTTARIRLGPLPDDEALALLTGLTGAHRVQAEPAAAATVVRRCGGLPLALRIVGARAAARPDASLTGLAERMDDEGMRLDVLEVGDLSVRASLHLGYQVFGDARQGGRWQAARLFRLAALPDWTHLTPYGCAALADLPVTVAEQALDALADAHLIESAGGGGYRFHDIVRLYARERAQAVDDPHHRESALGNLTAWLLAATTRAARLLYPDDRFGIDEPTGPTRPGPPLADAADAWTWFEREHTNLLLVASQQATAGRALTEVRDLALVAVKFLDYAGHIAEQQQFGHLAASAASRCGDRSGEAAGLNIVAVALLRQGRLDEAIPILERCLAVQRELGDRSREAAILNNLGNALRDGGDLTGALNHLRAALVIRRQLGHRHKEGLVLDNLALVYQRLGDHARAVACHEAGRAVADGGTDPLREAQALVNFAETLHAGGDHREAIARATESLEICRRYEHRRGIGLALQVLGNAHAGLGHRAVARRHWREALGRLDGLDPQACTRLRAALAADPTA
ncbi:tetratricopeptide repeat protein [Micromonospora sp. NPDC047730]|uniref:tetratricopeptide repeat protein n=1 Tax=Micromonospora sp. NPDC047730 TaxID=3364253 RepID=UPI0037149DCB